MKISQDRNSRQESGGRKQSKSYGGALLTGLLPMVCSTYFLTQFRATCPGVAPLTVAWFLPHQSSIKKTPHRLAYKDNLMIFLNWNSLLPDDSETNQDIHTWPWIPFGRSYVLFSKTDCLMRASNQSRLCTENATHSVSMGDFAIVKSAKQYDVFLSVWAVLS